MDGDLISKKELLELCGISYGALYRWKRKGLIPDDWFIRRSTYTGQETFFPRRKVLRRVELIMSRSENLTLDDLADELSPRGSGQAGHPAAALGRIVSAPTVDLLRELGWEVDREHAFRDLLHAQCADRLLAEGSVTREEIKLALGALRKTPAGAEGLVLCVARKFGVSFALINKPESAWVDEECKIAAELQLDALAGELRLTLNSFKNEGEQNG